jgi:CheY-like chemotaxis protein
MRSALGRGITMCVADAERDGNLLLLVEDHRVSREILTSELEAIGFTTDIAADAAKAPDRYERGRYGLVFTDIQLPARRGRGHVASPTSDAHADVYVTMTLDQRVVWMIRLMANSPAILIADRKCGCE